MAGDKKKPSKKTKRKAGLKKRPPRGFKIEIGSPGTGDIFTGVATGLYEPMGSAITAKFWTKAPDPDTPANKNGYVTTNMGRLTWKAEFDLTGIATDEGFLRAYNTYDDKTISAEVGSLVVPNMKEPTPIVEIKAPEQMGEVKQIFLVEGVYTVGDRNRVELQLLKVDNKPAKALIMPPLTDEDGTWKSGVYSFRTGDYFKVRATLKNKKGKILARHTVANLLIKKL